MAKAENDTRELLRNDLMEKAKKKYLANQPENAKLFWNIVEAEISAHARKSDKNKDKYFEENEKSIGAGSLSRTGEKYGRRVPSDNKLELLGVILLSLWCGYIAKNLFLSICVYFVSILLIVLIVGADYRAQVQRLQLKLRRYGETWVRHSNILGAYEQELIEFVCEVGDYESAPLQIQQKQFEARLLSLRAKNQEQFGENMLHMEESIE